MKIWNFTVILLVALPMFFTTSPALSTEVDGQYEVDFNQSTTLTPGLIESETNYYKHLRIYQALEDYIPDGYHIGPVESSCWYEWDQNPFDAHIYPGYWFVTLNPDDWWQQHAIFQIWKPPFDGSSPELIQEFTCEGIVEAMGWLLLDDEPVLFNITTISHINYNIATFKISPDNPRVNILSEEIPRGMGVWLIPNFNQSGPAFVYGLSNPLQSIYVTEPWRYWTYGIMTWRGDGFFTSNIFELGNFLSEEESAFLGVIKREEIITWALLSCDELPESIDIGPWYDPVTRYNLDGTPFHGVYEFAKHYGWEETDLHDHS